MLKHNLICILRVLDSPLALESFPLLVPWFQVRGAAIENRTFAFGTCQMHSESLGSWIPKW